MKVLKSFYLVLLCMLVTNCKVSFSETNDVLTVSEETDDKETKETNIYIGDVEKIRYFVGGWYGPQPNYKINLTMKVADSGKIDAELDTPECKLNAKVDAKDYAALIEIVDNDKLIVEVEGSRIDGGYNQIELTEKGETETIYVRRSDGRSTPLMSENGAKKLEAKVDEIVDGVLEVADCSNQVSSEILAFYYTEKKVSPWLSAPNEIGSSLPRPDVARPMINREFKIVNKDGVLQVHGTERVSDGMGKICKKHIDGKAIDSSLIADMEKVKFTNSVARCMYMPIDTLIFGKLLKDSTSVEGSPGCHASVRVTEHKDFQDKFLKWLRAQPAKCEIFVY